MDNGPDLHCDEPPNVAPGWLDGLRHVHSPNYDARPPEATIDLIVIHAISLPPGQYGGGFIEQLFTNQLDRRRHPYFEQIAEMRVSAHFLIDRRGLATQFVALGSRAWHAGVSSWCGRAACNDFSVGIELEGCDEEPYAPEQYAALFELTERIRCVVPGLRRDAIARHSDIAPGRKTDPGPLFDWDAVRRHLRE